MYIIQTNLKKILIALLVVFILIFIFILFNFVKNNKNKTTTSVTPTPTIKIIDASKNYKEANATIKVDKTINFKVDLNGNPIFTTKSKLPLYLYINSREQLVDSFKFKIYYDVNKMSFIKSLNKLDNYKVTASSEAKSGYILVTGEKKDKAKALKTSAMELQFLPLKEGSSFIFIKNNQEDNSIMIGENNIFKKAIGLSLIFNNK